MSSSPGVEPGDFLGPLSEQFKARYSINSVLQPRPIDGDKPSADSAVNSTKTRIIAELCGIGGFAWVTEGWKIENYLANQIYCDAMTELGHRPNVGFEGPYSDRCVFTREDGRVSTVDKLKLARAAMETEPELDVMDLRQQLERLGEFIRAASHKNI